MFKRILQNLTISQKLTISYFVIGVFSLVIVSAIYYQAFKEALLERTFAQLSSINILKKIQVEEFIVDKNLTNSNYQQKDVSRLDSIVQERTGMGETGETYIVSKDRKMITKSRFLSEDKLYSIPIDTKAVEGGFKMEEGFDIIEDYRGEKVLSYFRKIKTPGLEWVIISEIDFNEAMKPVLKIKNYIMGILVLFSLFIVYVTLVFSGQIANPIKSIQGIIEKLAKGIIPDYKYSYEGNDEIGQMVKALNQLIKGLRETSTFAEQIGKGNFKANFEPLSEFDVLGNTLIQMRDRIVELQQKELGLIRQRTSALLEGQEKERQRLARELHDGIGQLITGIRYKVDVLSVEDTAKKEIKDLLDDTIKEIRRISHSAMPSALSDFGLESALKALCVNISHIGTIHIEFDFSLEEKEASTIDFEMSTTLYRIAQEGFNNMLKYAKATKALLEVYIEDKYIVMELSDNGVGFDSENVRAGHGLDNIEKRAKLVNGEAIVTSIVEKGTKIKITLPLVPNEEN